MDGAEVQQLRFENISNNLANLNTNGFKKTVISFDQVLAGQEYSRVDFTPGPLVHTGNDLDLALEGEGFFKVMTAAGEKYTRDGSFTLDREGRLVTRTGDPVLGENGPITVSGNRISIGRDGRVLVDGSEAGRLSVIKFQAPQHVKKEGRSYYAYSGGEDRGIVDVPAPDVKQGYLEKANVDSSEEMIKMIEAFRTFEAVQKALQNMDEVTSKMVNDPDLL